MRSSFERSVRIYLGGREDGGGVDAGALERRRGLPGGVGDRRRGELQGLLARALQHRQRRLRGLAQRPEHCHGQLRDLAAHADDLVHRVHHLTQNPTTTNQSIQYSATQ